MSTKDLVDLISAKTGIEKKIIHLVLEETNNLIIRSLKKGDSVKISGFGTFYAQERKNRKGRNPKSGEVVEIPHRRVTRFRASKSTKVLT